MSACIDLSFKATLEKKSRREGNNQEWICSRLCISSLTRQCEHINWQAFYDTEWFDRLMTSVSTDFLEGRSNCSHSLACGRMWEGEWKGCDSCSGMRVKMQTDRAWHPGTRGPERLFQIQGGIEVLVGQNQVAIWRDRLSCETTIQWSIIEDDVEAAWELSFINYT